MSLLHYYARRGVLYLVTRLIAQLDRLKAWASAPYFESATGISNTDAGSVVYMPDRDGLAVISNGHIIPFQITGGTDADVKRIRKLLARRRKQRVG